MRNMGAVIEQDPVLEETIQEGLQRFHEGNPGHNNEQRYNLIATFQGEGSEKSILFNGHIDTMPVGDLDKWEKPLFAAVLEGGRCYGLGTSDMKSGLAALAVPGACEFKLCLHYIPGIMTYESVYREVVGALRKTAEQEEWLRENPPEIEVYQQGDGFDMERTDSFVQDVCKACRAVMGKGELLVSCTGNDARYYQKIARIPTVILGPGHPDKGHRPNEYIEIQNFYNCILVYADLILRWCH